MIKEPNSVLLYHITALQMYLQSRKLFFAIPVPIELAFHKTHKTLTGGSFGRLNAGSVVVFYRMQI